MASDSGTSSNFLRVLQGLVETALANILFVFMCFLALAGLSTGMRSTAEWLGQRGSPMLAFVFVVLCSLAWLFLMFFVQPDMMRAPDGRIRRGVVVGFVASAAFVWVYLFGYFSFLLMKLGFVTYQFSGAPGTEASNLCDAYFWQLLDLVPALDINKALGWNPSVDLQGGGRGFVLIVFKILIVFQLFALGRRLIDASKARHARQAPTRRKWGMAARQGPGVQNQARTPASHRNSLVSSPAVSRKSALPPK
jgi:hypothetical protein